MTITGSTGVGNGVCIVSVDHDPSAVATDAPKGSLIIDANAKWWVKQDNGSTTNVKGVTLDP